MRRIIVVAVREYQAAVKTKAFIFSIVLMPILMGGSILIQEVMEDKVDTRDKRFAVVDQSGVLYDTIAEHAREHNESAIFRGEGPDRQQIRPRFLVERATMTGTDRDETTLVLSDRVRTNDLVGFVLIGPDVVDADADTDRGYVAYHSNSPNYRDFQQWASGVLNDRIRSLRLEAADLDPEVVQKATRGVAVGNLGLVAKTETGEITQAKETNRVAGMLVPMGMMMLMFMVVMIGAPPLMQSVLEEKMQRIAEVLLGSVSPFQLLMGKLLGTVGVTLTIATLYLVGAYYATRQAGFAEFFPQSLIVWFVVFMVMAVLMFGSLFIAVGAAVSDMKEAQSMITPIMIIVMAPLFVWMPVVKEPLSAFATGVSFFPPATPMLMVLRQAVPPGIPTWQPFAGMALVLVTTAGMVFVASRIFRVGILMQGKGANLAEMLRWVIRG